MARQGLKCQIYSVRVEPYWRVWFVALRARSLRSENIPALPVSDWSVVRIYPRFLCPIGPL
eukprot:320070-Pyramimonas_sp.AAC.2